MVAALLFLAGACSGESDGRPGVNAGPSTSAEGASGTTGASTQYVLLDHRGWELQETVDYRAGLGTLGDVEPDLDWYAEYDGPRIDHDDRSYTIPSVSVSGHSVGLEGRRDQLRGFVHEGEQESAGRQVLAGSGPNGRPRVVIVGLRSDYSITLLSYDEVVDLRDLADRLVLVDEQQWVAAGGEMLDCVPLEPGCTPDD